MRLLAWSCAMASAAFALPFRTGATLDYIVTRDFGAATTSTSLRMLDSLQTDSGTTWAVAIRDSVHETGLVRTDTARVRRIATADGRDSLVRWDRASCLAAWEPEPYREWTQEHPGSGRSWWRSAAACFEHSHGTPAWPDGVRDLAHEEIALRPSEEPWTAGYTFGGTTPRSRYFLSLGFQTYFDPPVASWLADTGWSGISDDLYGELWRLEKIDGQLLPAARRWTPADWRHAVPRVGAAWTWEQRVWRSNGSDTESSQAVLRFEVLNALPDSLGWKGWVVSYESTTEPPVQQAATASRFELRQHALASWAHIVGASFGLPRRLESHGALEEWNLVLEGLRRAPADSAVGAGIWRREYVSVQLPWELGIGGTSSQAWIRAGVGIDSLETSTIRQSPMPLGGGGTSSERVVYRLLAHDGNVLRPASATRAARPLLAPGLSRLQGGQVRAWIQSIDGVVSLRAVSVSGRASTIDPRSPERDLARLHGLYTLEAQTASGVRRAMLLGM